MARKPKRGSEGLESGGGTVNPASAASARGAVTVCPRGAARLFAKFSESSHREEFADIAKSKNLSLRVRLVEGRPVYRISRNSFVALHDFAREKLWDDAWVRRIWDCNPNDPFDPCWGEDA